MSIKLKIEGFEDLLKQIEDAGGEINKACDSAIRQSAQIMQNELKNEMHKSNVGGGLIDRMPAPRIETEANRFTARVGYEKGVYDAKNPSDAFKAIFLNYGTPRRTKHGKVKAQGYIARAKKVASPKIKREQKKVFEKILSRLQK